MGFKSQREAFGQALLNVGESYDKLFVLDADTSSSTMTKMFADKYPERFINVGIAEPCLVDVAVGLSLGGYVPFVSAFAALLSLRALEQIRTCVAYSNTNVKIAAGYAGLSDFKDGPTHHSIIDIGIMRMLPGMTVIVPADEVEIEEWIPLIISHPGPVYFRLSRAGDEIVHKTRPNLVIGKGLELKHGSDVGIICTGTMVARSLRAASLLEQEGIHPTVLEIPTIKPIDEQLIIDVAEYTGSLVTVEEHSVIGGLGSAVCEVVSESLPIPVVRVGISDTFARTAPDTESLLDAFGMSEKNIMDSCKNAMKLRESLRQKRRTNEDSRDK